MQNTRTLHIVSETLKDRYPYVQNQFTTQAEENKISQAFGDRSIPRYINLVQFDENEEKKIQALRDVYDILRSQEKKTIAISYDLVEICGRLLIHQNTKIQYYASKLLSSLVLDSEGRKRINNEAIIKNLYTLLFVDDLREEVSHTFENISLFTDGIEILIDKQNVIEQIILIISGNMPDKIPSTLLKSITTTIQNVSKSSDGTKNIVNYNIANPIKSILSCVIRFNSEIIVNCINILWNIVIHEYGKFSVLNLKIIHYVIFLLGSLIDGNIKFQCDIQNEIIRSCSGFLLAISTVEDGKLQILDNNGVNILNSCLILNDEITRKNIISIITYVCEVPRGLDCFVTSLLGYTDILLEVLGDKSTSRLNYHLSDEEQNQEMHLNALKVTDKLCNTESSIETIIQSLDMIDRIVMHLSKDNIQFNPLAKSCLKKIIKTSDSNKQRVYRAMKKHSIKDEEITC